MKNYVQPGDIVQLTAPYAVLSGGGFLVGTLFAVALADAANAAPVEGLTRGICDLTSDTGTAWNAGDKVYWDNTAKNVTKTSTSNTLIGCCVAAKLSAATTGRVRLNGTVS
jgi:predicted RecA/RadA family phage recombinase